MSFLLRKCIDITPNGVIRPGSLQDYRNYRAQPWFPQLRATTSHVRMWADWPTLQPDPDLPFGDPRNPNHGNLLGLDEQIRLANRDGLKVVLLPYRYPRWVNGTVGIGTESDEYLTYEAQDRASKETWLAWWNSRGTPDEPARRQTLRGGIRALEYQLPAEGHGPRSAWGRYIAALVDRYVDQAGTYGRIEYLEVTNEPNHQLWPQRSPSSAPDDLEGRFGVEGSRLTSPRQIAQMMVTLDGYTRARRPQLKCLGPSTSDADTARPRLISVHCNTPYSTVPDPWIDALLDELDAQRFAGGRHWTWSFHNYNDFEQRNVRVQSVRKVLTGRWRGRQADGGPMLVATEGGCRLVRVRSRFGLPPTAPYDQVLALQSQVVEEAFTRHHVATAEGAGVRMMTYYTIDADPNFDCGLREAGGDPRPAFATFCGLREAPVSRRG